TAAVGLKPYSTVRYEFNTTQPVANDPNITSAVKYSGDGGLSEVYFGHGVKVAKDLIIGASASYVFGTITNRYTTALSGANFQQVQISEETRFNDFLFKAGLAYRVKLAGKYNLGFGGFYNLGTDLDARRRTVVERLSGNSFNRSLQPDSSTGSVTMPSNFQAGINFDNGTNWNVNLDVASQQWNDFRTYEGTAELQNTMRVGLGGEYVPEPASSNYLRRITYRGGLSLGQTPYQFAGEQLKETAVTWGFTFPVGRSLITESYFLNLGFALGKRGTTERQSVQENFIKVQAGISLSNKWFIQRKLE
ncbi:MAG TPA: hypothetical protein VK927_08365, partial [Adhaeribacter sp.]|nr:hypothetical protein [Adhaeribacter sp.]